MKLVAQPWIARPDEDEEDFFKYSKIPRLELTKHDRPDREKKAFIEGEARQCSNSAFDSSLLLYSLLVLHKQNGTYFKNELYITKK